MPGNATDAASAAAPRGAARRRVGRPPQISRQAIAEAAQQVGLGNLTLKAVADHLGVSVAGLYHHIRGKEDLLRLAADQALLRRVSVFAAPFTAAAAAEVAGTPPVAPAGVADALARLVDHSLLVAVPGEGTRYRALETIRQYGTEQLTEAGELDATRARHLRWCLATTSELAEDPSPTTGDWRLDITVRTTEIDSQTAQINVPLG